MVGSVPRSPRSMTASIFVVEAVLDGPGRRSSAGPRRVASRVLDTSGLPSSRSRARTRGVGIGTPTVRSRMSEALGHVTGRGEDEGVRPRGGRLTLRNTALFSWTNSPSWAKSEHTSVKWSARRGGGSGGSDRRRCGCPARIPGRSGVGGIGDQRVIVQHGHSLGYDAGLWVAGMHSDPRHGSQPEALDAATLTRGAPTVGLRRGSSMTTPAVAFADAGIPAALKQELRLGEVHEGVLVATCELTRRRHSWVHRRIRARAA